MCGFPKIDIRCAISTVALIYLIVSALDREQPSPCVSSRIANSDAQLKPQLQKIVAQYLQEHSLQNADVIISNGDRVILNERIDIGMAPSRQTSQSETR